MGDRYRSAAPDTLRIVPLDLLTVIHHRSSGQTHVVASPVPEILSALGDSAMDAGELLAALSDRYALGDADPAALAARLGELAAVGLVARA